MLIRRSLMIWIGLLTGTCCLAQHNATVSETIKPYLTYHFSDPDPVPNAGRIYPYFRYDGFSASGVKKNWKAVILENDYISVQVMPEIGGKIWTAIDKSTGKAFLYDNDVVKFRDIAMRGPWTSGGLESNFGIIGHTPAVANPVDYLTRTNEDGSASCIIGTLDLLTRARWNIEIRLPKDKAYFITRVYWHNATGIERPYYSWTNVAVKTEDSLQFIDPGSRYIGHDGKASPWPMDRVRKKDLSMYGQNNFGADKSYHIFGSDSKYFGAYWKKDDVGMIHYASREDKPGKKVFLWALSDEGRIWEKLLTDHGGQYAEIQSGRLFNQNMLKSSETPFKQVGFTPYQSDSWEEYWYPFQGTGGVTEADLNGVSRIEEYPDSVSFYFSAVDHIEDSVRVTDTTGRVIFSQKVDLLPLHHYHLTIPLAKGTAFGELRVHGTVVRGKNRQKPYLNRPADAAPFDWTTAYGQYLKGREHARFGFLDSAVYYLRQSLAQEPGMLPALSTMPWVQYRMMRYDSAMVYARSALAIDTYDPSANYYYGLASKRLGLFTDARDGFEMASMSAEFRVAAFIELSKLSLAEKDYKKALDYAQRSAVSDQRNVTALQLQYVCLRLLHDTVGLRQTRSQLLAADPLSHFILIEDYIEKRDSATARRFVSSLRSELPVETCLELSASYHELNLDEDASTVLGMGPANNETAYWRAFLEKDPGYQKRKLDSADRGEALMVFPFREETAVVMNWALSNTGDWKPKYYLALIADHTGNADTALAILDSIKTPVFFAPFYAFRARLYDSSAGQKKENDLERAVSLDKDQWRYHKSLAEFFIERQQPEKALAAVQGYYRAHPDNYIIGSLYTRCLLLTSKYAEAEKVLDKINILPFEGSSSGRALFRETKLMLALEALRKGKYSVAKQKMKEAGEWSYRLGAGKPYDDLVNTDLEKKLQQRIREAMAGNRSGAPYTDLEEQIKSHHAPRND